MAKVDITKPIRLGRAFWSVYAVLLGPLLWILKPWASGEPVSSEVIGAVLFPFLAAVVLYSSGLFLFALVTDFPRQRRGFAAFFVGVLGIVTAMVVVIRFPRAARGVSAMPVLAGIGVCLLSNVLVFFLLWKRPPPPGPQSGLASPSGGPDPRPE